MQSQSDPKAGRLKPVVDFLFDNSLMLVIGALAALIWANWDASSGSHSYANFVHFDFLWFLQTADPHHHAEAGHVSPSSMHFLVNDVMMAFFFAIAAKEVWEAMLPGGALANPRKAATPLIATVGGILGPVAVYLIGAAAWGQWSNLSGGWAVPCATDIAFAYLFARLIFGQGHPAISFLLLLAIADDAAGLVILAVVYPTGELQPLWLLATVAAIVIGLVMRRMGVKSFWWYLLPGALSWFSFYQAGIHAALGLAPIIPTLPHAKTDLGLFAKEESHRTDTLNAFEHWWKRPVEVFLGLFALTNAGVVLSSMGPGAYLVFFGLLLGKPLGICAATIAAMRWFRLQLPDGMNVRELVVLGFIAAMGFTVALFVATAAFPQPGPIQDSVKMGALLSFLTPIAAFAAAGLLGVRRGSPAGSQSEPAQGIETAAPTT